MKTKFENIKGMLKQEEMKMVIGGNSYDTALKISGYLLAPAGGSSLSGAQDANLGMTISYGNNGGNYSTSFNYGAGMNGSSAAGNNSTNGSGGSSTTGANTYNNQGYAKP